MARVFFLLWLSIFSINCATAWTQSKDDQVYQIKSTNEFVVAFNFNQTIAKVEQLPVNIAGTKEILLSGPTQTLILVKLANKQNKNKFLSDVKKMTGWLWTQANEVFVGDPRESLYSNDPQLGQQEHHQVMKNFLAWDISFGEGTVVAVTDDGVNIDHEDLKNQIWENINEIADNGIDDDNNGFIDDRQGWDFCGNTSNPRPRSSGNTHGTHVAGIIAAEFGNAIGIVGTAPKAKIMPLRWYGTSCNWTAAVIAKTYAYAADNGAKIINTSYNVDGFAKNPIYLAAIDYLYEKGVLLFNSAGNNYSRGPVRATNDKIVFVASTIAKGATVDTRSEFSNYGVLIDVSAPGSDIYSTVNGGYQRMSGTSMSSPNAAAVAALIWSANPQWTREQVVSKLYMSSDDIDSNNSRIPNEMGSGRVNSFRSVQEKISAPTFTGILNQGQSFKTGVASFGLKSKRLFSRDSILNESSWKLIQILEGQTIELPIKLMNQYYLGTNVIHFSFAPLAAGRYQFRALAEKIYDDFGQNLDGNSDGIEGDDFITEFSVVD